MISYWKQLVQMDATQKAVRFEEPVQILKSQLSSIVPPRNFGFYKQALQTSIFILFAYIWISFVDVLFLKYVATFKVKFGSVLYKITILLSFYQTVNRSYILK